MPCQIVYLLTRDEAQRIAINMAKMPDAAVLAPRHGADLLLPHVCSEPVSVLLQSPYVRFQQPKYSLGIQCARVCRF